ncbi:MAG: enoyl-CoA hydratase/isomerase family protein [Acidimicrobiales bacterium]
MTAAALPNRIGDVAVELGDDHVATLTIDRPPNNFFDVELIAALADGLDLLGADRRCRAVVLRSEGRHFCAGASFEPGAGPNRSAGGAGERHLYDEAGRVFEGELPVVAAVRGAAIGGGLGLALAADFRVGSPETRCSANFARLGFHHGFALTVTLPAAVGAQRACELLLTGARIDGTEAHRIGLLDRLVAAAEVDDTAHALAAEIAASAPLAVRSIRATMRAGLAERARVAMDHERAEQDALIRTADFAEGVRATAERRPPRFEGR